jgi:hypothetical protein
MTDSVRWPCLFIGKHLGSATLLHATLGATYSNTQHQQLGADSGNAGAAPRRSGTVIFNNFEVSIKDLIMPALQLASSRNFTTEARSERSPAPGIGSSPLEWTTSSKRTDFIFVAGYQEASGATRRGIMRLWLPLTKNHPGAVRLAIRHRFWESHRCKGCHRSSTSKFPS